MLKSANAPSAIESPIVDLVTRQPMTPGKAEAKSLVSLRQVGLNFGPIEILRGIDLDIRQGEFVCVVGPSGSGKTTLLRILAGLLPATAGSVTYRGVAHGAPAPDIAIVFQDYANALLPWRTAAGNISLALEANGVPRRERDGRIAELLGKVGLSRHAERFPGEMSGGMQQRLQIARCLAQEPAVLLMDEPFGALDAMTRQRLQDEVLSIVSDAGVTAFFVTHDLEEAIYLGDRVIALAPHPGRIAEVFDVPLPRPRNQLATREMPEFLQLRRQLFDFIQRYE
ncbi:MULTISPECIES: ABC transporter ATP-binding protein [unclassified Beijerinckia]|uniref:ABC transporter ATP-binding protein n=1 Tax=unclassified Beijerinckia TaxID=2638183 RepID=UPI00089A492E|nr:MULTISPECIES: ABC transporter ATP-binding protein [unclassified Beijerinckia]MDH7794258.1 NitT/TauT family transport system ATP-binding protein [Beijerinckia sp. GAS462]SEB57039.1 NitT/TauT family transport system ATP-binding protein [Beijerinckia sp. 28-YEA-48]